MTCRLISGNICGEIGLLALLSGKTICLLCLYADISPFRIFKYHMGCHKDVLVETALAVKISVYSFSMLVKGLDFFGMENALMYLFAKFNLFFLSPVTPFVFSI